MTRAMRKRLSQGLLWKTDMEPGLTWQHWLVGTIATLVFFLITALLDGKQANAELSQAKAAQIKAEVALVSLLNEHALVGDDGVVISPRIETIRIEQQITHHGKE